MENFEFIQFARARDFSQKINATFAFLKQNFKSLSKSLLFIAGPSVLISVALMSSMIGDIFTLSQAGSANPEAVTNMFTSTAFWMQLLVMMAFFMVTTVMTFSAINHYMVLYEERRSSNIDVATVWQRARSSFWSYVGAFFLFFLLLMAVYFVLVLIMVALAAISQIMMFFGILLVYATIFYLGVCSSFTFFIMTYEKKNFIDSLTRSFRLINGEWWSSFGYYLIIYLVMSAVAMAFILPIYIVLIVIILNSVETNSQVIPESIEWIFIVLFGGYYFLTVFLQLLPNVAVVFQYFNLVELKESRGLISQIESMGDVPTSNTPNTEEHY
jgi:hypothetical protein